MGQGAKQRTKVLRDQRANGPMGQATHGPRDKSSGVNRPREGSRDQKAKRPIETDRFSAFIYLCVYIYRYIYIYFSTYLFIDVYKYMYKQPYIHIYIYIYIYMYT